MIVTHNVRTDTRTRDRRQSMPFFCAYHLGLKPGRRMGERRAETARGRHAYVDRYTHQLVLCTAGIMLLSLCDAVFTLKILGNGGEELNWFMLILIEDSVAKFVAVKMTLTALALMLLVIHQNVRICKWVHVRHLQYMILIGYSFLIGYELYLLQLAARL